MIIAYIYIAIDITGFGAATVGEFFNPSEQY